MTRFLLAVAGIALSTNAALALPDCREFFSAIEVQRTCVRMAGLADQAYGLGATCEMLKLTLEKHTPFIDLPFLSSGKAWKDLEACKRIRDVIEPTPPTPTAFSRGLAALNEGNFDAAIAEFNGCDSR
jgi:hypothetical protein